MKITDNTILITGGGSGIGLALTRLLVAKDNHVIICGRDERKLANAARGISGLETKICDLSIPSDRDQLINWILTRFPQINVLINNASVDRKLDFSNDEFDMKSVEDQLATDLLAPIHLTLRLLPHLRRQAEAAVVNVTTGLVYSPDASTPVYSASKLGLHGWTMSLRYQLRKTNVRVFEVQPPIVDTDMISGLGIQAKAVGAVSPQQLANSVLHGITIDEEEIRIGPTRSLYVMSRIASRMTHRSINRRIEKISSKNRAA